MQIHELNTFSGALGDSAYLAVDNGTDTGKISTEALTTPLNERIDNIIAGDAPSAAEVTDARLGVNGETFSSLGAAIRSQIGDVTDQIENAEEALISKLPVVSIGWRQGVPNENTGVVATSTTRICTYKIRIPKYAESLIMTVSSGYKCAWYAYGEDGTFLDKYFWRSKDRNGVTIESSWAYLIVALSNTSNTNISTSEAGNIEISFSTKTREFEAIQTGYSVIDDLVNCYIGGNGAYTESSIRLSMLTRPVKKGERYYINPGSLLYGVVLWYGNETSYSTVVRNESAKWSTPEMLEITDNGFISLAFSKVDKTQDITIDDFDGEIRFYDNQIGGLQNETEALEDGLIFIPKDKTTYEKYINGNIGAAFSYEASAAFTTVEALVEEGKTYILETIGRTATQKYACYIDENGLVLKIENASVGSTGDVVRIKSVAPVGAVRVAMNVTDNTYGNHPLAQYAHFYQVPDYLVELEESLSDGDDSPNEQYINVQAARRVFSVTDRKQNIASNKLPTFLHVADNHGDTSTFSKAVKIADDLGVDAILNTGDSVFYSSTDDYSYMVAAMADTSVPMLPTIGNHDSYTLNEEEMYNKFIKPFESGLTLDTAVTDPTYYYKDFPNLKLRVINVNQFQYRGRSAYTTERSYHPAQIDFFCNALLTAPNDYGVIVMMHTPEKSISKDSDYSKFYQNQVLYDYTGANISPIYEIVDAYISGSKISKSWENIAGNDPTSFSVNIDFSAKNSSEFVAYVCGHMHRDAISYVSGTTNKQLILNAVCTCAWSHKTAAGGEGDSYPDFTELSDLPRIRDTATETAINIYTVDLTNKNVKVVRIGSDTPYNFADKRDYMVIPYV